MIDPARAEERIDTLARHLLGHHGRRALGAGLQRAALHHEERAPRRPGRDLRRSGPHPGPLRRASTPRRPVAPRAGTSRWPRSRPHHPRHQHHHGWDNANPPVLTVAPGETVAFETVDASGGQLSAAVDGGRRRQRSTSPRSTRSPARSSSTAPSPATRSRSPSSSSSPRAGAGPPTSRASACWPTSSPSRRCTSGPTTRSSLAPALYGPGGQVPLKPFAGTIGVAPAEPGLHSIVPPRRVGGNMDIRDLAAGTKLYLPVEVAGALFSVGDTHAAQGDGEVCGTAIESPMTVALTFDLIKARQPPLSPLHHPRPGDPPPRRQGLRGHHRHRPRPDGRPPATRSAA